MTSRDAAAETPSVPRITIVSREFRPGPGLERKKIVMKAWKHHLRLLVLSCAVLRLPMELVAQIIPSGAAIDAEVSKVMTRTHANGMAVAVIDHGKVSHVWRIAHQDGLRLYSHATG